MYDLHYIEQGYIDEKYFTYVADALCDVSSNSTLDCTAITIVGQEPIELAVAAQLDLTPTRIVQAAADWTGVFSPSIIVDLTLRGTVEMESTVNLAATALRIQSSAVEATATSTMTADGLAVRLSYEALLSSTILAPNPIVGDEPQFGKHVAFLSDRLFVSAPYKDLANTDAGIVYEYTSAAEFDRSYPGTNTSGQFGSPIAATATRMFSAYGVNSFAANSIVYQYNLYTGAQQRLYLNAPGSDRFGISIASNDTIVAIGADLDDAAGYTNNGRVYVYNVSTGALLATLAPDTQSTAQRFGASVAIDGNWICVGSPGNASNLGAVYIFDATTYQLIRTVVNPNIYSAFANDYFAENMSAANGKLLVSAAQEGSAQGQTSSGVAYLFDLATGSLLHTLINPNVVGTPAGDFFSASVSLNERYAVVAANAEDLLGTDSGVVYIWDAVNGSLLLTIANPNANGSTATDAFGTSVSINALDFLAIGSPLAESISGLPQGAVYVYQIIKSASEPIDVVVESTLVAALTRAPYEMAADLAVDSTQQTVAVKTCAAESAQYSQVDVSIAYTRIRPVISDLFANTDLNSTPSAVRSTQAEMITAAELVALADKIKINSVQMLAEFTQVATANQLFGFAANWTTNTQLSAAARARYIAAAQMFAQTGLVGTGRTVDLNRYIWYVDQENRYAVIEPETRDWLIQNEKRNWLIA